MLAAETDIRRNTAARPTLAQLMLTRGAPTPVVAPRNIEQAVTEAEQASGPRLVRSQH